MNKTGTQAEAEIARVLDSTARLQVLKMDLLLGAITFFGMLYVWFPPKYASSETFLIFKFAILVPIILVAGFAAYRRGIWSVILGTGMGAAVTLAVYFFGR